MALASWVDCRECVGERARKVTRIFSQNMIYHDSNRNDVLSNQTNVEFGHVEHQLSNHETTETTVLTTDNHSFYRLIKLIVFA
jgi:hypothetical protein